MDAALSLTAVPWLWLWWGLATSEHAAANLEEGATAMATIQRIPPDMLIGYCSMCGDGFQYARALPRPPKTCGALVCGRAAKEPWAKEEVAT